MKISNINNYTHERKLMGYFRSVGLSGETQLIYYIELIVE